jgi:hypothetical protein
MMITNFLYFAGLLSGIRATTTLYQLFVELCLHGRNRALPKKNTPFMMLSHSTHGQLKQQKQKQKQQQQKQQQQQQQRQQQRQRQRQQQQQQQQQQQLRYYANSNNN